MDKTMDVIKTEAEIGKLMAETVKLNAEAAKLQRETKWLPLVWSVTFAGAVLALAKLFSH
jgi:hypothetical protein